ncbi:hypothetical protein GPECTOR_418g274 [Gonium pectorale]|uniref:Uncharacterized protein n=1 Tax=Gonium pectorale TaxID=33097 RepID=A0A150FV89_GONPE|nr:hypothetical protein GPECTOR_418g274 [Gonium pectorale]|eukprot:KXZ41517.1 hypothetical protein GPECTOR_418g274 [Gonium pectorale]
MNTVLTCDAGRQEAELQDWLKKPAATRGPCPLGSGADRAQRAAEYITKYALKSQSYAATECFIRSVRTLAAHRAQVLEALGRQDGGAAAASGGEAGET